MSAADRGPNNVKAGLFVVFSLIGMFAVILFLSDSVEKLLRKERSHTVLFDLEGGVKNLQPGGDVRLGGVTVGNVTSVRLVPVEGEVATVLGGPAVAAGDEPAPRFGVEVAFTLDDRYELHRDADVSISAPLVGSEVWLDITDLGGADSVLAADERLAVRSGAGLVGQLLGPDAGRTIEDILVEVSRTARTINGAGGGADAFELASALAAMQDTVEAARDATDDVRDMTRTIREEDLPRWRPRIDSILTQVGDATGRGSRVVDDVRALVARVDDAIERNEPRLDRIVADAEAISTKVRETTLPELDRRLADAGPAIDAARGALEDAKALLSGARDDVGASLVNVRLASQQAGLLVEELRRAPWKALYRPKPAEYENQLLYETARGLALAAERLESATARANRLVEDAGPALEEADPQLLARIRASLDGPLEAYAEAQQRLLEVLVARSESGAGAETR